MFDEDRFGQGLGVDVTWICSRVEGDLSERRIEGIISGHHAWLVSSSLALGP